MAMSFCLSVSFFVRLFSETCTQKRCFSQKLSSLKLWSLLPTSMKFYMGFSKNPSLDLYDDVPFSGDFKVTFVIVLLFCIFLKYYTI